MIAEQYVNNAISTLSSSIISTDTTLTVAAATAFPTVGNFHILVDNEIMRVTSVSGTTFTITRGVEGTTAASHTSGVNVICIVSAEALQNLATNPIGNLNSRGQGMFIALNTEQYISNALLMGSSDGVTWDLLRPLPVYKPPTNNVKDTSIYYDGTTYWMVYTIATNTVGTTTSTSWGVASSPDLINWTHVTDVSEASTVSGAAYVQGPEWFIDTDGSVHVFYTVGTSNTTAAIYKRSPTNIGMTTWSAATVITGTGLATGVESPFVIKVGSTYYLFIRNNSNYYIELWTSTSLTSGYTVAGSAHWMTNWPVASSANSYGAPCFVQISSTVFFMYVEKIDASYNGLGMYYSIFGGTPGSGFVTGGNYAAPIACTDPFIKRSGSVARIQDIVTMRNAFAATINSKRHLGCMVTSSTLNALNNTAAWPVPWTEIVYDDANFLSGGVGTTKLTIPVTGLYHIDFYMHWASNAVGVRIAEIRKNGVSSSTGVYMNGTSWNANATFNDVRMPASGLFQLNAGDWIDICLFQNCGGNLGSITGPQATIPTCIITKIR